MLMDVSRNLPTCKLKNQKEPEFQLTVAKKLYMMQVQGRVFFFFLPLLNSDSLKYVFCKGIKFKHLGKGRKSLQLRNIPFLGFGLGLFHFF